MRFEGRLKTWHAERGFGFIAPAQGGQDIFVHARALPPGVQPPQVGERLSFEIELSPQGKKRATRVERLALQQRPAPVSPYRPDRAPREGSNPRPGPETGRRQRRSGPRTGLWLVAPAVALTFALMASTGVLDSSVVSRVSRPGPQQPVSPDETLPPTRAPAAPEDFHCDGRLHCSQMRSCKKAQYFLAHCPGVKMDGDGDGIPCERQHCGH